MRKGFLGLLAALSMVWGMATAESPVTPGVITDSQPVVRVVSPVSTPLATSAPDSPNAPAHASPVGAVPSVQGNCNPCYAEQCACGPPGRFWAGAEYLYWWTKASRLPSLVTSGSTADAIPGAIGQSGTRVLFGGNTGGDGQSGVRIGAGFWLNDCHTIGFEANYFVLGSRSSSFVAGGTAAPGSTVIARPFLNIPPTGGAPFLDSELVSFPGTSSGVITVENTTRLQGAEANALFNLLCCESCCCGGRRIDLIGGFRWMELNESLTISERISPIANRGFPAGSTVAVTDQFATQNDFYGPQIGVRAEWWQDRFFVNARTLVAFGTTHERATINGTTVFTPAGGAPTVLSGGLLALPTNMGSHSRDEFTVVPEIGFNAGYQFNPHLRAYAGYTFTYWSNVVRPGDVIDTGVNPSQLPTASGPGRLVGPARPAFQFHDSSFWAQGVNLGIEVRY